MHIKEMCDFQPFIISCLQQPSVQSPMVPCIRRVALYQAPIGPSVLNSSQKHVSTKKTSSKNTSRKSKNDANHTEAIVPDSKIYDEIPKLVTSTGNHLSVSETAPCVTFSDSDVSKQSVSAALSLIRNDVCRV